MTFPGGTHDMWIRYWLAAGGIDPDKDVSTIVVPPPQMVANMKVGNMDAFCVGEPWGDQLVHQDIGFTACMTGEIWKDHPEKSLGMRADWVDKNPKAAMAVLMAVMEAQQWCDKMENKDELANIIGKRQWFNVPPADINARIKGDIDYGDGRNVKGSDQLMTFWARGASYPVPEPRAVVPHREPALGQAAHGPRHQGHHRQGQPRGHVARGGQEHQRRRRPTFPRAPRAARRPSSTARCSTRPIPRPTSPPSRSRRWRDGGCKQGNRARRHGRHAGAGSTGTIGRDRGLPATDTAGAGACRRGRAASGSSHPAAADRARDHLVRLAAPVLRAGRAPAAADQGGGRRLGLHRRSVLRQWRRRQGRLLADLQEPGARRHRLQLRRRGRHRAWAC